MKRLSRWLSIALAAGAVVTAIWGGVIAEGKSLQRLPEQPGTNGPLTVTGDSTTYYLYEYLLPNHKKHVNNSGFGDSTSAQFAALWTYSNAIDVRSCDGLSIYGRWDADSVYYKFQYSMDGTNWTTFVDSICVNSAPARSFPPVATDFSKQFYTRLYRSPDATDSLRSYNDFDWAWVRFGLRNGDVDSVRAIGASIDAAATSDTAINVEVSVWCSD